jgi:hypothetical protein
MSIRYSFNINQSDLSKRFKGFMENGYIGFSLIWMGKRKASKKVKGKMARIKAKCSKCEATILLLIEDKDEADAITSLDKGEYFEHECPKCEERSTFEVVE